jgi:hypothetical protein
VLKLEVEGGNIIFPSNSYLSDESLERREMDERIFELHKRYLSAILKKDGRKVRVNWFEYASIIQTARYEIKHDIERYVNAALIVLGVLTENPEKAWRFSDSDMNPEWGVSGEPFDTVFLGRAYFVNKNDIVDYANANWKDRTDWTIFQMKNVLKKEEVC